MRLLLIGLLFPLAAVAQSTLLWACLPGGVTPDLCLLLTLACGLRWGAAAGSAAGLWAGTLVGALAAWASLPGALLYGAMGWLAGCHAERTDSRWTYPLVGLLLVALLAALEGLLARLTGASSPPFAWLLPTLGWHALACLTLAGVRR